HILVKDLNAARVLTDIYRGMPMEFVGSVERGDNRARDDGLVAFDRKAFFPIFRCRQIGANLLDVRHALTTQIETARHFLGRHLFERCEAGRRSACPVSERSARIVCITRRYVRHQLSRPAVAIITSKAWAYLLFARAHNRNTPAVELRLSRYCANYRAVVFSRNRDTPASQGDCWGAAGAQWWRSGKT